MKKNRKMEQPKNWISLQDFFKVLNEHVEYLVLRNFEDLLDKGVNTTHPDIDILCRDSKELIHYAGSVSRTSNPKDLIHQKILIDRKVVSLDVRHVGDGYYDEMWETDMLDNRRIINDLCFVMDETNYFYSLLYHALIQKNRVNPDYKIRLENMGKMLAIENPVSIRTLEHFMRKMNYYFTYPENPAGIANFKNVDKSLIKKDLIRLLKRKLNNAERLIKKYIK